MTHDVSGDSTLAVGTNGQVLVVDSAAANGIKWGSAGDLSSPGPIGNTTPSTGEFTDLSAGDNLKLNGLYKVRFVISVKNDSGTIKHRASLLQDQRAPVLPSFPSRISGLSATAYTATPLVKSTVDFATGAGLQDNFPAVLFFDWTNAQSNLKDGHIVPTIVYNSTGTHYYAYGFRNNHDVNGTQKGRLGIVLSNVSGALKDFNTTNIPSGKEIVFVLDGWVE